MPNALLARYFAARAVLTDFDFDKLSDTNPDALMGEWNGLDGVEREQAEAEFRDIFHMSCESGFRAIIDEASWHLRKHAEERDELIAELAGLANHYERAMVTFLDHQQYWGSSRVRVGEVSGVFIESSGATTAGASS